MKSLNQRFGKAKYGCSAEREYVYYQLLDVEAQLNSAAVSGIDPACGVEALREVRDGYRHQIEEMSK